MASVAHEKIVRVRIAGAIDVDGFGGWIVPEAQSRGIDGWVRGREDDVLDMLLAGPEFAVDGLVFLCTRVIEAADATLEEYPLRGDEPIWSGFHCL